MCQWDISHSVGGTHFSSHKWPLTSAPSATRVLKSISGRRGEGWHVGFALLGSQSLFLSRWARLSPQLRADNETVRWLLSCSSLRWLVRMDLHEAMSSMLSSRTLTLSADACLHGWPPWAPPCQFPCFCGSSFIWLTGCFLRSVCAAPSRMEHPTHGLANAIGSNQGCHALQLIKTLRSMHVSHVPNWPPG